MRKIRSMDNLDKILANYFSDNKELVLMLVPMKKTPFTACILLTLKNVPLLVQICPEKTSLQLSGKSFSK